MSQLAQKGADALINHLRSTGTGENKLAVAKAAPLGEASTEQEGAAAVIAHMEKSGIGPVTLAKAHAFARNLPDVEPRTPARREEPKAAEKGEKKTAKEE